MDENLYAFAAHHFFGARSLIASPKLTAHVIKTTTGGTTLHGLVTVTFPDGAEPQGNELFWSVNRHPDYTFQMEFDEWKSAPLRKTGKGTYAGEVVIDPGAKTVDLISVHKHKENGIPLTVSSHEMRVRP